VLADTNIATTPIATASNVTAKPNIMFILDNSGSMTSAYMPDDMYSTSVYGYYSSQCNGVAYDPTYTYNPPVYFDSSGTKQSYPNASFSAAWNDGFVPTGGTTNLANKYYYKYTGTQTRMGWTYTASGVITSTTFYKECMSAPGNSPGSGVFTKVTMTSSSTDAQNYANWWAYYRTRRLMMRTAVGNAFASLDSNYRVGFTVISDSGVTQGSNWFVDTADFNTTQKQTFYSNLYAAYGSSNTPLRGALSKIGRYFANKISGQNDPMQYSCQRNYAIVSTDGYWNTGTETSTYGPLKLDGTTLVGEQDRNESRPMKDSGHTQSTEVKTWNSVTRKQTVTPNTTTTTWTRYLWTVPSSHSGCSGSKYNISVQKQVRAETATSTLTSVDDFTTPYTETIVTTDGAVSSDTTSTGSTSTSNVSSATAAGSDTFGNWGNSGNSSSSCKSLPSGLTAGGTGYSTSSSSYNATTNGTAGTPSTVNGTATVTVISGPTTSTPTSTITDTSYGGDSNTLADIAEYYYSTDLRSDSLNNCISGSSGNNVCENNIAAANSRDNASWQHMTTMTIGLGVNGTLAYDSNYLTEATGDYVKLTQGTLDWPVPEVSSSGGNATNVDDLWHAAVNGRGQYFATTSASSLATAITTSLATIQAVTGSSAAAATTSLKPVAGDDNEVFIASYRTYDWTGDVQAHPLDSATGAVTTSTTTWSAQTQLDGQSASSRTIYYLKGSSLKAFTYSNLTADGYNGYFDNFCSKSNVPTQCSGLTSAQTNLANSGSNLVSYLRGDKTYEVGSNNTNPLYRTRAHTLGDIVDSSPVYVKKPPFSYTDTGYASFVSSHSSRKPVVYVGANDGMLHAFSADTSAGDAGTELWAYVPSMVMSNMYRLADTAYSTNHQYFVDGAPIVGDIDSSGGAGTGWMTILVGGLNDGGKGYYALDITNPTSPQPLWEFTNANLGLSYGNPIITKLQDGTWVVVLTSGYNNSSGDGKGHLFVLNAKTGALLRDISTTAGSSATPSGLAKINAWIDDQTNNTSLRFYGGDLLGNLWRFDVDDRYPPSGNEATLLATFQIDSSHPQPITVAPQTALITSGNATYPVVMVGTGEYLSSNDVIDTTQQSIYAIKDQLGSTGWGDARSNSLLVKRTLTVSGSSATFNSTDSVDWSTKMGWAVDLPNSKERVVVDMAMQFNTLVVASAIPGTSVCTPSGGSSWLYELDVANGTGTDDLLGNYLAVGITWIETGSSASGTSGSTSTSSKLEIVGSDASITQKDGGSQTPNSGSPHRTSWRELAD
jgi:type IV pilus assembly protein PilY1